jgi:hypothetical protein
VAAPELRELIGGLIVRRLLPAIERYFQFQATRMDRYIIACYDSETGGHFYRHRDNIDAGAQHRRFAVAINLNSDYDGCVLLFPEFGRKTYRAPAWCFRAGRFIESRQSTAGGATPFWRSSTRRRTPQGAKPITPGFTKARCSIPASGTA